LKSSYCIFVFISLFLFPIKSTAQKIQLDFNLVSGKNGISLGKINGITQDKWGYMWFVDQTNKCLVRFDEYRMKTYRNDPLDTNSIDGVNHECIAADSTGCIWVDAARGVDKFDPYTGKFIHFRYPPTKALRREIYKILIDHLGTVWVGTNVGLDRLDQKTGKFFHYAHKENDPSSLSFNIVRSLYEDHQGVLWIGTGFPFLPEKGGGLNRFDRKTETFTSYRHEPDNPHSLINDKIGAIFEDSRGTFWVCTQGDGLHIMDRKTGSFTRLPYDPNHPEKLSRPPVNKGNPMDHITFITEDMTGAIWIGTYAAGINRYDPVKKKITHYQSGNGFPDSTCWTSFLSRDGVLWISTENSELLYRVDPSQGSTISSISTVDVARDFVEDRQGYLWVATRGNGLLKYDQHKNLIKQYKNDPSNPLSLNDNRVNSLFQNQDDIIWVGTWKGLQIFNKVTQQFSRIPNSLNLKDSLDDAITAIFQDNQGLMWFGRWSGGLIQYNPKDSSFKHYYSNTEDSASIGTNVITDILEDRSGELWVGGFGEGINRLNRETGSFKHYMSFYKVQDLYEDSGGRLWAGTTDGLYLYNQKEDRFTSFFDPLAEMNSFSIEAIIEDNAKDLWLKSDSAIIKLNPITKETFIYGGRFGIRPNSMFFFGGIYKNRQGQIYIGHDYGFYTFFPEELAVRTDLKVIITDLFINALPVLPGKGSPIQKPAEEISDLELKYNQNNITFDFAAIDYREQATKYFTRLETYDNAWRKAVSEKSSTYFNVPPGTYVYRVRAYNSEGVKTEKAITIRIYPPWWLTWWFITSAISLLVASFYLLIRWWSTRKQLERTEKEKQIVELEMQALRSQMNPHFIFNSLNSINMFILENNKLQASEYLSKFSRLIRLILQNSQEAFISLEKELEALQLYLELEFLRFVNKFEYKIAVEDNIDTTMLKVPPLIIQPYAENAIWHGLMHKKEKGHLDIHVYAKDEMMFCKITDDGIGRKKATDLKSKSGSTQKSMGMRITADRIAILQQQSKTSITITDLVLSDGSPGGTEVLIKIPVIYD